MAGRQGKEGLEDATMKIVHLLQTRLWQWNVLLPTVSVFAGDVDGRLGFRDIHEALKIDYRSSAFAFRHAITFAI